MVVETKSGSAAGPLDRHLWHNGIRPTRISKFATGMAALMPGTAGQPLAPHAGAKPPPHPAPNA